MGDLVRDGFHVRVRFGLPEPSALQSRLLMRTRIVTCASPAYVSRHGLPQRPRDIEKHEDLARRARQRGSVWGGALTLLAGVMRAPATGTHFGWEFVRGKKVVPVNVSGQLAKVRAFLEFVVALTREPAP